MASRVLGSSAGRPFRPSLALAEIAAMAGLILSYIWCWQGTFRWHFSVCVALYFALGVLSHLYRGETPADLGLRLDNWREASRNALKVVGPLLLLVFFAGVAGKSLHFPSPVAGLVSLLLGILWGTAQQYGLLCIFYRRLGEFSSDGRGQIASASVLFALLHLPNPFLCWLTLATGAIACSLYRRVPNVPVLGTAHALVSFVVSHALPETLTYGMRVGPGFFEFPQR